MLAGFYLRLATETDRDVNARIHALTERLLADLPVGVTDLLPGYVSLYVEYDPRQVGERPLRDWLEHHLEEGVARQGHREVEIPVRYDGEDLRVLAEWSGLSVDEVVARHSGTSYLVYAVGFAPGFPFMGEVVPELRAPRHSVPRRMVPAHSVGIAGAQTGIYPRTSPGGWQLIGRALTAVYDPHREEPFLLAPGDQVRFTPGSGEPPAEPKPVELLPSQPERPFLEVLEPGLLDLVVDRGRMMVGRFGLARSGPLDGRSAALANSLLGNPPGAPLIEMNLMGPVLSVLSSGVAAFAGEGIAVKLNGRNIEACSSFALRRGDELSLAGSSSAGCRGYLAIAGGVEAKKCAGSASVDLKGLIGRALAAGDVLGSARPVAARPGYSFTPYDFVPYRYRGSVDAGSTVVLRLLPGPQPSKDATEALNDAVFRVAAADRVGLRLEGTEVPGGEVLSEGVPIGAIQVPPGGSPILLLNDRGSLGGYTKPALIHPFDLRKAGQLKAGDWIRFVWTRGRD